ncbi:MAG: HDIG domain-containing metalloprotein, partial [Rhodothermales bacterium]
LLILAYPLLWVFERVFDVTTDLTLLELSDTNRPLLKELSLRAPGTFNHSLQVANLAEGAADAVGANALLTRVGALYHDIGKMLKPEYFVENQRPGTNPHTQLKPRMSALIIASHVKEGLEMGRQYKLPQRVLDFIPMHHGTTRIEFFYRKALDQRKDGDPEILESEFRYPGPRPHSKETGILILADSVEAASRSLSDPTHKRLESLIEMIFTARIEDGQLDRTDLTFRDLDQIKETFLSMLLGIYHVRVKYPGQIEAENAAREADRLAEKRAAHPEVYEEIRSKGVVGSDEQSVPVDAGEFLENEDESERRGVHEKASEEARAAREKKAARGAGPATEKQVEMRARSGQDESEKAENGKKETEVGSDVAAETEEGKGS